MDAKGLNRTAVKEISLGNFLMTVSQHHVVFSENSIITFADMHSSICCWFVFHTSSIREAKRSVCIQALLTNDHEMANKSIKLSII